MSDEQLAVASLQDPYCFGALVDRHRNYFVIFLMRKFSLGKEEAEDICQEAYVRAYQNLQKFDSSRKWKTWLYQIGINCSLNYLRKPKTARLDDYSAFLKAVVSGPEEKIDYSLRQQMIEKILAALDSGYRKVLELYYVSGWSCEKIGKELRMTNLAVRAKIKYAERALLIQYDPSWDLS
jgi:RNA polymerase sigma factor (sigma-70 family)